MHVIYWLLIFVYLITFNLNCCCGLERLPRIWKVWCSSPCTSGDCPRAKRLETRANGTMYHTKVEQFQPAHYTCINPFASTCKKCVHVTNHGTLTGKIGNMHRSWFSSVSQNIGRHNALGEFKLYGGRRPNVVNIGF